MTTYYTKQLLLKIFESWKVKEPVPKKGKKVLVCFPRPATISLATITYSDKKSPYNERLYKAEFSSKISLGA